MVLDLEGTPPPAEWGVTVDLRAVERLAEEWAGTQFLLPAFDYPGTPTNRDESWWYDYVTLAVSVLACLWAPEGEDIWHAEHQGEWLDDAPGVFTVFTRQLNDQGLDLDRIASLSQADGERLFAGSGTLLQIPARIETLRSTATALRDRWDGSARNLVEDANRDGAAIVERLIDTIPAFHDRPETPVGVAHFDKLAHLAAALMAAGVGWADAGFDGYDDFPVYPDYMLPRVFRHYGAMIYGPSIAATVDQRELIEKDSLAEYAIRWATVYCGAQLKRALTERGAHVTGPALDYHLWSIAVLGPDAALFGEHHRTLTMKY